MGEKGPNSHHDQMLGFIFDARIVVLRKEVFLRIM